MNDARLHRMIHYEARSLSQHHVLLRYEDMKAEAYVWLLVALKSCPDPDPLDWCRTVVRRRLLNYKRRILGRTYDRQECYLPDVGPGEAGGRLLEDEGAAARETERRLDVPLILQRIQPADVALFRRLAEGVTQRAMARERGVTAGRMCQIVQKVRRRYAHLK